MVVEWFVLTRSMRQFPCLQLFMISNLFRVYNKRIGDKFCCGTMSPLLLILLMRLYYG